MQNYYNKLEFENLCEFLQFKMIKLSIPSAYGRPLIEFEGTKDQLIELEDRMIDDGFIVGRSLVTAIRPLGEDFILVECEWQMGF